MTRTTDRTLAELARQLTTVVERGAWHGPAVFELLADVDARRAAAVPPGCTHSIWALTIHMGVWLDVARRRTAGDSARVADPADDFPAVPAVTAAAWRTAQGKLRSIASDLRNAILALFPDDLARKVRGQTYTVGFMLHGAIQHTAYHAGQIALLKKL